MKNLVTINTFALKLLVLSSKSTFTSSQKSVNLRKSNSRIYFFLFCHEFETALTIFLIVFFCLIKALWGADTPVAALMKTSVVIFIEISILAHLWGKS